MDTLYSSQSILGATCQKAELWLWSSKLKLVSRSILHYSLVSGCIKKLFSIHCVNIYFSQSIVKGTLMQI